MNYKVTLLPSPVAQYILRNPFSLQKITFNDKTWTVIYRSKVTHGKNKKNFNVYSVEEFIAVITQHISDKCFQTCTELIKVWFATMDGMPPIFDPITGLPHANASKTAYG